MGNRKYVSQNERVIVNRKKECIPNPGKVTPGIDILWL
jgi:hypothetical protein